MKIAVAYKSMTGHSKKLAKAIAKEFSVEAVNVKKPFPEFKDIDILFFAGGIYAGTSAKETISFISGLNSSMVKSVALITSSASDKTGQYEVRKILAKNKIEVIDEYRCRGGFLFIKMGHPNREEIADAVEFSKKLQKE